MYKTHYQSVTRLFIMVRVQITQSTTVKTLLSDALHMPFAAKFSVLGSRSLAWFSSCRSLWFSCSKECNLFLRPRFRQGQIYVLKVSLQNFHKINRTTSIKMTATITSTIMTTRIIIAVLSVVPVVGPETISPAIAAEQRKQE